MADRSSSTSTGRPPAVGPRFRRPEDTVLWLQAVLASTLDPVVIIDAHGTVQSVSDSVDRVFGWGADELIGQNITVLMPEPHASAHDGYLEQYRLTGVTSILGRTREFEGRRKDGTLVPIEISVSRVDLPDGEQPYFTAIIHDITERKRSELELRLIQQLALDIAQARDVQSAMKITLERICEATGWDYGEAWLPEPDGRSLMDTPVWQHARSSDLERFQEATQGTRFRPGEGMPGRVWASREPEWLEDLGRSKAFVRAEAAREAGFSGGVAVPILAGDEVAAVVAFLMRRRQERDRRLVDLVAAAVAPLGPLILRKHAEDALTESERRVRTILERIELAGVTLDHEGRVTFCNDFLLDLTGWEREQIIGRNWFEMFIAEDERPAVLDVFERGIGTGDIEPHFENDVVTRSGERRRVAWNNIVARDGRHQITGVTSLGVDVTEQRALDAERERLREQLEATVLERTRRLQESHEKLRQADRLASIGTLAAGLGHDMNNVLLPIRCRLEALETEPLPELVQEHFVAVRRSVDYLQNLADGLHLLALDPEDGEASTETTDLTEWWEQVGGLLGRSLPKHVRLATSWASDLPRVAVAPHRLTQAVLNLIVNAGEAVGDDGRVRVWAEADPKRNVMRLGVTDNGCGMSEEVTRRALDPFFTTKKRGLGTGLGLSLVHGVVRSAGGEIEIRSDAGRGSTIVLELPAAPRRRADAPADTERCAVIRVSDPRVSGLIRTMFEAAGLESGPEVSEVAHGSIWVVEPTDEHLETVRAIRPRPIVVLVGEPDRRWAPLDPIVIADPFDILLIREAVSEAIGATE